MIVTYNNNTFGFPARFPVTVPVPAVALTPSTQYPTLPLTPQNLCLHSRNASWIPVFWMARSRLQNQMHRRKARDLTRLQ